MTSIVLDSCVVIRFLGKPMDRDMRFLANYDHFKLGPMLTVITI